MKDVFLSSISLYELEAVIEKAVTKSMTNKSLTTVQPTIEPLPKIGNKEHIIALTGWPSGTFYQKVAQMPEGVVIRGKSKRLLFDMELFVKWLKTPVQP